MESKHTVVFNRALDDRVCPDNLAGALELFFSDDFRNAGSANFVRPAQPANRDNDFHRCIVSDRTILGPFVCGRGIDATRGKQNRATRVTRNVFAIDGAFIAPWWFSPALSYWPRRPRVAGSRHEPIGGIGETAR